jgi:tetratricopeptide (TPR) repeat protein/tRNA A-37 threonylcarbamoyl transferase component Bud32
VATQENHPDSGPLRTTSAPSWYSDEDLLLGELRRSRADRSAPPQIPGYDDLREIRRGGQGIVYSGVQRSTKRRVAVKILIGGDLAGDAARRRFEREIDLAASLRHPGIVRVYDSGLTSAGWPYLVMEFVEGLPLSEFLRTSDPASQSHSPSKVIPLFAKVAAALAHAHQHGVIHRDLKPSNIRVDSAGEPRILDFGLAKLHTSQPSDASVVSQSGQFVGSLPWASPEQVSGDAALVDVRTDVYALGVMLYRELTGRFPYAVDGNVRDVVDAILTADPPAPRSLSREISEDCQTVVLKCLAKDPARRYQSAADLEADLAALITGDPVRARADSTWYALSRRVRRYKVVAATGAVIASTAVVALAVSVWFWTEAAHARDLESQAKGEAVQSRDDAVKARDKAQSEASQRAEAMAFLERMLTSADPGRDGRNVKVADVLRRAAAELAAGGGPRSAPLLEATTRAAVGRTYSALGLPDDARRHLSRALELRRANLPPGHEDILSVEGFLIQLESRAGQTAKAIADADEAVATAQRIHGPDSAPALRMRSIRAEVYLNASRLDDALKEMTSTLEAQRRVLGNANVDTIVSMTGLGVILRQMSRTDDAEKLYREAMNLKPYPEDHPDWLDLYSNLVQAIHDQNRLKEAEPMYRDLIERQSRVLGADHPSTLVNRSNYATLLIDLGRLDGPDGAEAVIRATYAALTRTIGPDRFETLLALNNLAKVVQDQGRLEESLPLWEQCYDAMKRTLGPGHRSTLITGANLGVVLSGLKRYDQSVKLQREIVDEQVKSIGPDHISTLISTNNLARTLQTMGKPEEAIGYFKTVSEAATRTLQEGHLTTGLLRGNYARCLSQLGRNEEALTEIRASVKSICASLPDSDSRSRQALTSLAEICEKLNLTEEAAAARARLPKPEATPPK